MKSILLLLIELLLMVSCGDDNEREFTNEPIDVRIKNVSNIDFDDITILITTSGEVSYGSVAIGQTTDYRPFSYGWHQVFIWIESGDNDYSRTPVDAISRIPEGKYTLEVEVNESDFPPISYELKKD